MHRIVIGCIKNKPCNGWQVRGKPDDEEDLLVKCSVYLSAGASAEMSKRKLHRPQGDLISLV
jgi:hypothetical protein